MDSPSTTGGFNEAHVSDCRSMDRLRSPHDRSRCMYWPAPSFTIGGSVTLPRRAFPQHHAQPGAGRPGAGDFQKALGPNVTLDVKVFNAGPSAIEAMFAGQLDLSYIAPIRPSTAMSRATARRCG